MNNYLDPNVVALFVLKGFFDVLPVIKTKGKGGCF